MHTYTGIKFYPSNPRLEDINIIDIAHGLSNMCRFSGQCFEFYSVAEHCLHISYNCKYPLWGLLHDAPEAYVVDVPSPIKAHLPEYKKIENNIMKVICTKYNLSLPEPPEVKETDIRMLATEISQLFYGCDDENLVNPLPGVRLQFLSPKEAKSAFLMRFFELVNLEK